MGSPPHGGMGSRLKTANTRLNNIANNIKLPNGDAAARLSRWKRPVKIRTNNMLAAGPAAATLKICLLVRIEKLTGTGLAQPKRAISGKIIVPNRLICAKGFKVSRPIRLAVSSPYRYAIQPCAYS